MTQQLDGDGEQILQAAMAGASGSDPGSTRRLKEIGDELLRLGRTREASRLGQILDDLNKPSLSGLLLHVRAEIEAGNDGMLALLPERLAKLDQAPDDEHLAVLAYLAWSQGEMISARETVRFVEARCSSPDVGAEESEFLRLANAFLALATGNVRFFASAFGWSRVWATAVALLRRAVLRSPQGTVLR